MKAKAVKNKPSREMLITILGCGTSVGVPMIGRVEKHHKNPKNQRLRASILVEPFGRGDAAVLIDTSPDLRQQVMRYFPRKNPRLDAVLMTHEHADHLHGIDDIRPFNFLQNRQIPFYGEKRTMDTIRHRFEYIFFPTQIGGGLPQISLEEINDSPFTLRLESQTGQRSLEVIPLPLIHGVISCLGFRIGSMAYITDCSAIPETTLARLEGLELLILDCLRPKAHTTHLNVEKALAYARRIRAKKTIFTHMATEIEYESFRKSLPKGMMPAYDGQQIRLRRE